MRKTSRISLSLLCAAMATTLSAGPAWAECQGSQPRKECGGIGPAKIPCACNDTVVADTILDKSDPVMKGNCCPPYALPDPGGALRFNRSHG